MSELNSISSLLSDKEIDETDERDLDLQLAEDARKSILDFTEFTKPDYQVNWHHRALAAKLDAFARGEIKYLMVFMPPRHGKSELVSRRLPAYLHGLYPDAEIMAASYSDSLASDMATDVQNIMDSQEYQQVFPGTKIHPSGTRYTEGVRNTEEHHIVGRKGKYRGQGVGGSFTGKGANFIIIDDPIKGREAADSLAFREKLWNFYNNDLFSRLETDLKTGREGQVLVTLTRWHEDDLAGRLLELMSKEPGAVQWEVVNYPAIRVDMDDATDPREIDEPLWERKFSRAKMAEIKVSSGARAWSSLWQQNPVPAGGVSFNENMFDFTPLPGDFDFTYIMADTAYKDKQENDFTCFTAFGIKDHELYITDVWKKQIKAADVEKPAAEFCRKHSAYGFRGAWIEPKGHGIYLNQRLPKPPYGISIPSEDDLKEFFADRKFDKMERANNVIPYLSNRKVHINENLNDKEDLLAEVISFPKAKHDDFTDTVIDGVKKAFAVPVTIFDVL